MYSRDSNLQDSNSAFRFSSPQIPLLSAPPARFNHPRKGPHFAVLPLGLESLSVAQGICSKGNKVWGHSIQRSQIQSNS